MSLKNIAIGLNVLLILLFFGYLISHGFPKNLILWGSAILWLVGPLINILYILKKS